MMNAEMLEILMPQCWPTHLDNAGCPVPRLSKSEFAQVSIIHPKMDEIVPVQHGEELPVPLGPDVTRHGFSLHRISRTQVSTFPDLQELCDSIQAQGKICTLTKPEARHLGCWTWWHLTSKTG
jgi:hypothetical protein